METVKTNRNSVTSKTSGKFISIALIISLLLIAFLYVSNAFRVLRGISLPNEAQVISQNTLEEKYGLRVNLIAVTAAGGMVDLRIKFFDADKARLLLGDKKNFPALWVSGSNMKLNAPEDTKSQEIKFEKDGGLYLLFPNSSNAVKPGTPVTLVFGNIRLEPIPAR